MSHSLTERIGVVAFAMLFAAQAGFASYVMRAARDIVAHSGVALAVAAQPQR